MVTQRPNGSLYTRIDGAIAHLEFGHPASNSFVMELLDRLASEIGKLSQNPELKLIVLRSEGDRAFCAGASFDELLQLSSLEEGKRFFGGFAKVINAMRTCTLPIVGRVQGKAVGGGVGLVAACDYVLASEHAAVRLSEISIGIAPLVIAPAVERKVGKAALAELAFSPTEWKNAYWARDKGLFSKVYPNTKELDKELDFFVSQLATYGRPALEAMTKVLWEGTEDWDSLLETRAEMSGKLGLLPETKRVLNSIKKKR